MKARITTLFILLTIFFANASEKSYLMAAPTNDDCANAISLTVNSDYTCSNKTSGTVSEANPSSEVAACVADNIDADDVWYKFVATETSHRISLLDVAGGQDMYHVIYDAGVGGVCTSMTAKKCSNPDTSNYTNYIVGNTYYIRVFTNSAGTHNTTFDICVGSEPDAPSNDDCANSESITAPFSTNFDASAATNNAGFVSAITNPSSGENCTTMNDGVWYKIAGDGNELGVTVLPDGWDVAIGVYTGTCGSFTCVKSTNEGISGTAEGLSFVTTSGTDYFINVANASSSSDLPEGVFTMNVTSTVLSIDKLIAKGFAYYPNPVSNELQVLAKEEIKHLAVYNAFGQELRLFSPSDLKAQIDLSDLPLGPYFIRAYVGDAVGMFKVIKK